MLVLLVKVFVTIKESRLSLRESSVTLSAAKVAFRRALISILTDWEEQISGKIVVCVALSATFAERKATI